MSDSYFFPDNTVLINFAIANQLDLLRAYLSERGRVVAAVRREIIKSSGMVPNLHSLDTYAWFGPPIEISTENDIRAVESLRVNRFGGLKEEPLKHLGESQTIHVMATDPTYGVSRFLTDDDDAYRLAKRFNIVTRHTVEVFREMVAFDEISDQDAFESLVAIRESPYDRRLLEHPMSARDLH
jgi:hypothetical protein